MELLEYDMGKRGPKPNPQRLRIVTTSVPPYMEEQLKDLAREHKRSVSQVVRLLLEDRLAAPPSEKGGGGDGTRSQTRMRTQRRAQRAGPRAILNKAAAG